MATGLLGKVALAATTNTAVYTVTAGKSATANIRVINRDLINSVTLRLAMCPPGYTAPAAPANADYIEPIDLVLPAGGVLEESAMAMSAGEVVVAYASAATVTVRVYGFES
ncbi:hypothetical protein [Rugamonas aquatica]|uniref:Uncharacterized protein n=1 Tax=Rugamonas aquatica TaxID=2743357 RepID=A0A6A7N210_9BURK|nr:hypothetical protein [Rugamonas aquatica]MQA39063.1 hypothetical protein [Rugamonas aquatica]